MPLTATEEFDCSNYEAQIVLIPLTNAVQLATPGTLPVVPILSTNCATTPGFNHDGLGISCHNREFWDSNPSKRDS